MCGKSATGGDLVMDVLSYEPLRERIREYEAQLKREREAKFQSDLAQGSVFRWSPRSLNNGR